jgi:hypothetical protein
MRDDQIFEIERAFDLLPHVCGASWAVMWFRLNQIKDPSSKDFRKKTKEYFEKLLPLFESYPDSEKFNGIRDYILKRKEEEIDKIISGTNPEIEKRYKRYIEYG